MARNASALFSMLSLVLCLAAPLLYFLGTVDSLTFKQILAVASLCWFVFATIWATRR